MKSNWWSKLVWLINVYKDIHRSTAPHLLWGARLMKTALLALAPISFVLSISLPETIPVNFVELTSNDISFVSVVITLLTWGVGCGLVIYGVFTAENKAQHTARVLINGLPSSPMSFPNYILSSAEKRFAREPAYLSTDEVGGGFAKQIEYYNAELRVDLFNRFILQNGCEKLYIGGLARVPFLVSYGALLRNVTSEIEYFDKSHSGDKKWFILDSEDLSIEIEPFVDVTPNSEGDIGIAVGFTSSITDVQLPEFIRKHTVVLGPNTKPQPNLIKNKDNLNRLALEIKELITRLSSSPSVKRVHFFLSVQTVVALAIGRVFQEGIHKQWVIHNYDGQQGKYVWALELSAGGITEFKISDYMVEAN